MSEEHKHPYKHDHEEHDHDHPEDRARVRAGALAAFRGAETRAGAFDGQAESLCDHRPGHGRREGPVHFLAAGLAAKNVAGKTADAAKNAADAVKKA